MLDVSRRFTFSSSFLRCFSARHSSVPIGLRKVESDPGSQGALLDAAKEGKRVGVML